MSTSMIRLLFIEDNRADALLVREMLDAAQHIGWDLPRCELKHVVRLQEGLGCLENESFDVILSDLDLPDSQAEDTVATLREHAPQMPLVVLTGREDEALARKSVRAGVQDYLYKNEVTGSLLARSMMYAIERQGMQERLERRVEERTAELRDREEHYQSLFENAPISIWEEDFSAVKEVIDDLRDSGVRDFRTYFSQRPELVKDLAAKVKVLDINRYTVEMYEAEDKHEFRRNLNDIFGETSYDAFIDTLCVIAAGKTELRCEKPEQTLTGKDIETDLRWSVVPGYEETYAKVLVSIADVTEYKRMEQALKRRAEDLKAINELAIHLTTAPSSDDHLELIAEVLKSITNALAVVTSVYDPEAQALTVTHLAAKGKRIARMNELLGRRIEGFSMPVSDEVYAQITQEVERKVPDLHAATLGAIPKPVSTAAQRVFGIDHCISLAFTDRDKLWGSAVIVMSKGQTSPSDEVMEIFARVTAAYLQQRQAEDALLKSEERFRLIAESSSDVIFQLDLEGRVTYCSPAVERVLGFGPDEVTGIHLTRFFSRSGQAEALHNFAQVIATGCGVTLEAEIIDHTGSPVSIEATLAPIQRDGHVVGVQGHARDVTERKQMEEEIEGERAFLAAVIDNIKEAVIICDEEGRITRFNEAARQLHGLPERPIPPDQWAEYYDLYREDGTTPLSTEEIPLFRALQGERVHDAEIVVNPEHDEPHSLVCNGQAMVDESGQLTGAVVTMHDITARKKVERELRELAAVVDLSPDDIVITDMEGKITYANPAMASLHGLDKVEEAIGTNAFEWFVSPDKAQAAMQETLEKGSIINREFEVLNKRGESVPIEVSVTVLWDESHQPTGFAAISRDITARKRVENVTTARLRIAAAATETSSEALMQIALDEIESLTSSKIGFYHFLLDDQETIALRTWSTNTLENMCNAKGEGKHYPISEAGVWADAIHERRPIIHNDYQAIPHRKGTPPGHVPMIRELVYPIIQNERIEAVLGVGNKPRDYNETDLESVSLLSDFSWEIIERKRAEEKLEQYATQLERSNQELEQFAYVISHDLREPARLVKSYLELLQNRYQGQLDEKADMFINHAVDGAERMQEMIEALLDLSRVGRRGEDAVPTNTEEVLKRVLRSLERAIEDANAEVTHDSLPTVLADRAQLAQVFQNLIANAVKFQRDGVPPRIHISAEREGDEWVFSVADNGIGIDPEQAARIFQIFQRLHAEEEYPGLGIGLALCKRIVERHGGRIWVESEPGEGSTFYFTLLDTL